jgi:hypothetical protein
LREGGLDEDAEEGRGNRDTGWLLGLTDRHSWCGAGNGGWLLVLIKGISGRAQGWPLRQITGKGDVCGVGSGMLLQLRRIDSAVEGGSCTAGSLPGSGWLYPTEVWIVVPSPSAAPDMVA